MSAKWVVRAWRGTPHTQEPASTKCPVRCTFCKDSISSREPVHGFLSLILPTELYSRRAEYGNLTRLCTWTTSVPSKLEKSPPLSSKSAFSTVVRPYAANLMNKDQSFRSQLSLESHSMPLIASIHDQYCCLPCCLRCPRLADRIRPSLRLPPDLGPRRATPSRAKLS